MGSSRTNALDKTIVRHILEDTSGAGNLLNVVGSALFLSPLFFTKADGKEMREDIEVRITYFSSDIGSRQDKKEALFYLYVHGKRQQVVDDVAQRLVELLTEGYNPRPTLPKVCPDGVMIGRIEDLTEEDAVSQSGDIFLKKLEFKVKYVLRR